jgi:hypothetical protein
MFIKLVAGVALTVLLVTQIIHVHPVIQAQIEFWLIIHAPVSKDIMNNNPSFLLIVLVKKILYN